MNALVYAQQQIVAEAQSEREGDVDAGGADPQIAGDEHKQDDAQVEKRAQGEIGRNGNWRRGAP
jgi:hypothetical protein